MNWGTAPLKHLGKNRLAQVLPTLSKQDAGWRMVSFVVILALLWLPINFLLMRLIGGPVQIGPLRIQDAPTIFSLVALYSIFIFLLRWWGKHLHGEPHPLNYYGWIWTKHQRKRLVAGLILGYGSVLLMYLLQSFLGWITWNEPTKPLLPLILEGGVMAILIGLAEELLFRGWMWGELRRDYSASISLWVGSGIFALLHCLRPWHESGQGFALLLLGMGLCLARLAGGGIAYGAGIHGGLVWLNYLLTVGQLVSATGAVPGWVTGVDGNPLAGVLGVGLMGAIAFWVGIDAAAQQPEPPRIDHSLPEH